MELMRADLALAGGGGAAMALLLQLCRSRRQDALTGAVAGRPQLEVVVVDPVDRLLLAPQDRTWCYWERTEPTADTATSVLDPVAEHSWSQLTVLSPGHRLELDLAAVGMRYAMVRSAAFYRAVRDAVADPLAGVTVHWLPEHVTQVLDGPVVAQVRTPSARVAAGWVFDSTPARPSPRARTALLQHFRGVLVRADAPLDPARAVLMDLRTAQPAQGLSFGYVLPLPAGRALVEYTEFSPRPLSDAGYSRALGEYLGTVLAPGAEHTVEHTETGAIPMTDARHRTRAGERVFRIGTAGGATRASTGYTFAAMHRQARGIAALLRAGQVPQPPAAYPARHRRIDGVLLRGLQTGRVDGTQFFPQLFARNPVDRVLDFLDGATTWREEVALMRSVPAGPMLLSAGSAVLPSRHGRPADPAG